jgi:hypothetical protein
MKVMAILLYVSGLSMNAIAQLFNVSAQAVLNWVRDYAKTHCKKPEPGSAVIVELDEFWHFIESKKKLWIWKAYECLWHAGYRNRGRLIDWELGGREWLRHASLSSNFEEVVR